jgi:hypothetical protein
MEWVVFELLGSCRFRTFTHSTLKFQHPQVSIQSVY